MRRLIPAILIAFLFMGLAVSTADAHRHIVREVVIKPPKRVRHVRHFTPPEQPKGGSHYAPEVMRIEQYEQSRWGGPLLINRSWCESSNIWNNGNGTYDGLFAEGHGYFAQSWAQTPRGVHIKHAHTRKRHLHKWRKYSDGSHVVFPLDRTRKQRVVTVKKGRLPKHATVFDAWAATRIAQRAVVGLDPIFTNSSWECNY